MDGFPADVRCQHCSHTAVRHGGGTAVVEWQDTGTVTQACEVHLDVVTEPTCTCPRYKPPPSGPLARRFP